MKRIEMLRFNDLIEIFSLKKKKELVSWHTFLSSQKEREEKKKINGHRSLVSQKHLIESLIGMLSPSRQLFYEIAKKS